MSKFSFNKVEEQNPLENSSNTYKITGRTVNGHDPELIVKHAGDGNQPYLDFVVEETIKQQSGEEKDVVGDDVKQKNIGILVDYLIVGWKDVYDDANQEVPFSKQNCRLYLNALNPMKIGTIISFCMNEGNFTKNGGAKPMPPAEVEKTAKNSQGDSSTS